MHLPLPSRVIDVEAIGNGEELRLHITHPDELGQYAALSYCCGLFRIKVLQFHIISRLMHTFNFIPTHFVW